MALLPSSTLHLTKSCSFERSRLNCNKFNNNCVLKEGLLAHKNFDFLKTRDCTPDTTHFTSMVSGNSRFSVVAEHGSSLSCKIAASVLPREGYPELPELSDNRLPSSKSTSYFKIVQWRLRLRKYMQLLVK